MSESKVTRRRVIQGAGAAAAVGIVGFPYISRAQADVDPHRPPDAAHRLPRAARRVRGAGRRHGGRRDQRRRRHQRPQDRTAQGRLDQPADRLHQGRAHGRARQGVLHHRRDLLGVGPDDQPGRRAHQDAVHQHRLQLRRAARQGLQEVHVPHREPELDVREDLRPLADVAGPGQGQEVVLADRRLRLRPRPAARGQEVHVGQRRRLSRPTSSCRPTSPTSRRCCSRSAMPSRTW